MTVSRISPAFIVSLILALLAGCASTPAPTPKPHVGRAPAARAAASPSVTEAPESEPEPKSKPGAYYQDDGPGESPPPNLKDIPDAEVRAEPYAKYANRPYKVFGKLYTPMLDEQPFVQRGQGSWYGKKFHGQKTSSGERYDMYKMTAAHPTLPIPSYARVTNVATGKQVVVRINDRGPFHAGRIVDLSYTAAVKLGLMERGSDQVIVERVLPGDVKRSADSETQDPLAARADPNEAVVENRAEVKADTTDAASVAPATAGFYVQVGAFSRADKAGALRERVAQSWSAAALDVVRLGALHKVLAGPYATRELALEAARALPAALGLKPIVIQR